MKFQKSFRHLSVFLSMLACASAHAETEDWYTYWGLGLASHEYEEPLESAVNDTEALPGVSRSQVALDLFGFYWPFGNQSQTIAGFVMSGSGDRLEDNYDYYQINHHLYGASVMHFFGKEIGDGLFVRGDLGIAKVSVTDSFGYESVSENGSGFLLGLGYSIPMSSESRLMFTLSSSNHRVEGHEYNAIAFKVGGLW